MTDAQPQPKVGPKSNRPTLAPILLLAIGFVAGILAVKIYDQRQQRSEVKKVLAETTKETAWMRVKAFRAPIYSEPHRKATAVGMYFKNFRLEIAGKSSEWVKIGPERYMHLSDLEGIETKKF